MKPKQWHVFFSDASKASFALVLTLSHTLTPLINRIANKICSQIPVEIWCRIIVQRWILQRSVKVCFLDNWYSDNRDQFLPSPGPSFTGSAPKSRDFPQANHTVLCISWGVVRIKWDWERNNSILTSLDEGWAKNGINNCTDLNALKSILKIITILISFGLTHFLVVFDHHSVFYTALLFLMPESFCSADCQFMVYAMESMYCCINQWNYACSSTGHFFFCFFTFWSKTVN